jgi:hypothetical protein
MNNKPEVIQIVETILPTNEDESDTCAEENGITSKCREEAIIFQTLDENGFIQAQRGSLVMASIPQIKSEISDKCYPAVDVRNQYSSTTIVGSGGVTQVCCFLIYALPRIRPLTLVLTLKRGWIILSLVFQFLFYVWSHNEMMQWEAFFLPSTSSDFPVFTHIL